MYLNVSKNVSVSPPDLRPMAGVVEVRQGGVDGRPHRFVLRVLYDVFCSDGEL